MKFVNKLLLLILLSLLTIYWKWSTAQIDNAKKRHVEYHKPVLINGYVVLFSEKKWERNAQRYSFRYTSKDVPKRFIEIAHNIEGNHDNTFDVMRSIFARPVRKLSQDKFIFGGSTLEGSAAGKALYGAKTTPWWGALPEYRLAKQIAELTETERNKILARELCDIHGVTSCSVAAFVLFGQDLKKVRTDKQALILLSTVRYGNNDVERKKRWAIRQCIKLKQKIQLNVNCNSFKQQDFISKNKVLMADELVWINTAQLPLKKERVQAVAKLAVIMKSINEDSIMDITIANADGEVIARISNNAAVVKGITDGDRNLASLSKAFLLECLREKLNSAEVLAYATSDNDSLFKIGQTKVDRACLKRHYGNTSIKDMANGNIYMNSKEFQRNFARIVKHSNAIEALRAPMINNKGTLNHLATEFSKAHLTIVAAKSGTHAVRSNESEKGVYGSLIAAVVKDKHGQQLQILIRWHGDDGRHICVSANCTKRMMHKITQEIINLIK